ncbi:lipid IV(A) 3-deoxy-D-manno-octulosonic acid transferase [Kangiella sp. HZ709]|uniref:lipid IV(A) 3-deoxy-D-manno-octulosonic acid transferase n=1 Tax=Kangiella sp. HZ709 TaxID=2666328 RepID=UPI0012AEE637|nr:lipid IV(A) 3-deoxy-D-manno-octulosonic acid transferase [Kangiella sp. HZ709]MRX28542.1 3-deoxy-D-manno-octulosonic acid transferase [Kangiella sp. HZ709]
MVKGVYTFIYYLLSPLMCIRWFFKSLKPPKYREPFRQRFGFVKKHKSTDLWFHAVSMGETSGAISIINKLLSSNPELNIVVTTTTPTGAKLLLENLGDKITHYYSPCDLPGSIKRFVSRVSPKLVVIMETELWPNWLSYINQQRIPIILANARLSESSARKYSFFKDASKSLFSKLSKVLAVNEADAQRFVSSGVSKSNVEITGNIKFDAEFPQANFDEYFPYWNKEFVWIAASTHHGEDEQILQAHKQVAEVIPSAKLILVPRHPERFESVAELISQNGFQFSRRSERSSWKESASVLLGDTMGELLFAYEKSNVAFIGGSFVDIGGHNAIEAAYYSKPVLTGPDYHNFQYLFDSLIDIDAARVVIDNQQLATQLILLANDNIEAELMGEKARAFIDKNKGALEKVVTVIQGTLPKV